MITYEMCLDVFIFDLCIEVQNLLLPVLPADLIVELVFTYMIDRYTSGNELEPNMTTRAAV